MLNNMTTSAASVWQRIKLMLGDAQQGIRQASPYMVARKSHAAESDYLTMLPLL